MITRSSHSGKPCRQTGVSARGAVLRHSWRARLWLTVPRPNSSPTASFPERSRSPRAGSRSSSCPTGRRQGDIRRSPRSSALICGGSRRRAAPRRSGSGPWCGSKRTRRHGWRRFIWPHSIGDNLRATLGYHKDRRGSDACGSGAGVSAAWEWSTMTARNCSPPGGVCPVVQKNPWMRQEFRWQCCNV